MEFFVACVFPFLPFVSEVPTEPVQGNSEAIVDVLIIQSKQAILPDSHSPGKVAQKGMFLPLWRTITDLVHKQLCSSYVKYLRQLHFSDMEL